MKERLRNALRWAWEPLQRMRILTALGLAAMGSAGYLLFASHYGPARLMPHPPAAGLASPAILFPEPAESPQERERWSRMAAELEKAVRSHPGPVAVYLKDLKNSREWAYHADDLFPSASLIKVPIMISVYEKIRRGELSLDARLTLRRRSRMGGSGSIKWRRDGTRFTVRQLLDKMMLESDNTAMRLLIDEIGMGYLQEQFPRQGLIYTEIFPEGLSLNSGRVKYENYTTAREMSMLLEKIYHGKAVDGLSSELMLETMKRRRVRSRLAKTLPAGWEIAHKTGLLRRACHDSAVIFGPDGDYVLTVLTGKNRNYQSAKRFISQIGLITYRHQKSYDLYAQLGKKASGHAR